MSVPDRPDGIQPAPSWRCPECRTLQARTLRCWRCDTPAFTCETCRFYHASVAAGLGYCAADASRVPLRADESRSCWQPAGAVGPDVVVLPTLSPAPGLFAESELAAATPAAPVAPIAPPGSRASPRHGRRRPKPPLESPGRAAWVEPESDALVEAPMVEPGKRLSTEVRRRRSRWHR